jgi:hypothetical protein
MARHRIAIAFAIALVALSASADVWYSMLWDGDTLSNTTKTKVLKHTFGKSAVGARIKLNVKLSAGTADVRLVDPTGTKRFEKAFNAGRANVEETFKAPPGEWQVVVAFHNATGDYSVKLTGLSN